MGVKVQSEDFDVASEVDALASGRTDIGAIVTFIIHRTGELSPGDNIVLVVTASAHRQAAFEAAGFLMDYLKTRAPFWKKETSPAGESSWVEARENDETAATRWRPT